MNVIAIIKRIDLASFWMLLRLCIKHPLFLWPTFKATKVCLQVSTQHFGTAHYQNTPANAFRHAYWNYLIARKCTKWSESNKKIMNWTSAITDWHENAFKNRPLARLMDLHNNKIGRTVFLNNSKQSTEKVLLIFLEMTKDSIKISKEEELPKNINNLVHITDYQ
ncbi:DUF6973 domain-containing protein [Croceitalea rosinachiae]|uniref:DUF6973 domain-containing protein n=1 Tax=Croceitalea rosinachiae TaxID=3075596 RepID=A0ABU3A7I5_9FLAO|nr:hypothetical protein [Croceitalea sp. F388]MDT0606129.1 hypothetical protein [Croceitalea sp. F388]